MKKGTYFFIPMVVEENPALYKMEGKYGIKTIN
jgi:hypothetical protein